MTTDVISGVNDQLPPVSAGAKNRYWFFLPDKTETAALIQRLFYPETVEETEDEDGNTVSENSTSSEKTKKKVKLEVLNGSGSESKYDKAVELLKGKGYEVTETTNTSSVSKTIITNKKELDEEVLKDIQTTLGGGSIGNNKNLASKVDATIIIGKDFNQN